MDNDVTSYKVEMFLTSEEVDIYLEFLDAISSSEKFNLDLKKLVCFDGASTYCGVYKKMLNGVKVVESCEGWYNHWVIRSKKCDSSSKVN